MDNATILVFQLIVLIFSVIIHEVSHGLIALKLGDPTAKEAGRLTLNPIKHLDFFGSFLVPVTLFFLSSGAFVLGWAKPVPYNPYRLKKPKIGAGLIAAAGPASNLLVAIIFGLLFRLAPLASIAAPLPALISYIIFINVVLAVFNLLPIPPLDGSGILFSILSRKLYAVQEFLERYGFAILILFILFGFSLIFPIILRIYQLIAGGQLMF